MLKLYIDRGNTALKWQLVKHSMLVDEAVFSNDVALPEGLAELAKLSLCSIYVSSVASNDFCQQLTAWAKENGQPIPVFVESTREAGGVINAYKEAGQLGVDRWLAMIAARSVYAGMLCVVDSGTALTMDFILENGEHLGGVIVPGATLMQHSLLNNTQKIHITDTLNNKLLGRNTSEAVVFGIEQMLQVFVREKVAEIEREHNKKATVILTGGHAKVLAKGLSTDVYLEKDLVLQGLKILSKDYK